MIIVNTTEKGNTLSAPPEALIADYKARGMDEQAAWNQFVKDRALKPDIDFKVLRRIYAQVTPAFLATIRSVAFVPTHHDTLLKMDCNITVEANGVYRLLWADGSTGSNPPSYPPAADRFVPLT